VILPFFAKPDPDAPLVSAARGGDVRAFDALVYRYQSRLGQFVRARLDAAIDVDDVTQEIFLTAWRELPKFRAQSRFKTWLFGIALNRCAEAARKHLRLRIALGDGFTCTELWTDHPSLDDPYEYSAAETEREIVRHRVAALPEPERRVLELYYYAELNLREISELTSVNLSTVKYRFYQAHRKLREQLVERETAETRARCPREH